MREANTAQLIELLGKMPPQVALVLLDLVVDTMDVFNRDEIVKRIRQLNGQRDPDQTKITPEEMKAAQAQQQQQAAQAAMFQAELGVKQAAAAEMQANAAKAHASAMKSAAETISTNVKSQSDAMIAATAAVTLPTIAPVADAILQESGWVNPLSPLPIRQQQPMPSLPPQQQGQQQLSIPARMGILPRAA